MEGKLMQEAKQIETHGESGWMTGKSGPTPCFSQGSF